MLRSEVNSFGLFVFRNSWQSDFYQSVIPNLFIIFVRQTTKSLRMFWLGLLAHLKFLIKRNPE